MYSNTQAHIIKYIALFVLQIANAKSNVIMF